MPTLPAKPLPQEGAILLRTVQVHLLDTPELRERAQRLHAAHHYLGGVQAVSDRHARYGHPVLVVETFVDPERFQGGEQQVGRGEKLGQACGGLAPVDGRAGAR